MTTPAHRSQAELAAALDHIRQAPSDLGRVQLLVRRPAAEAREIVDQATLNAEHGLHGDNWLERGSRHTEDGSAEPDRQLTVMNSRAIEAIAGPRDCWPPAGDQIFVDLDLSGSNLPAGSQIRVGEAVIEVSAAPHTGCAKFTRRFGRDAARFVNSPDGRQLNLRGINARVVESGPVGVGDTVAVMSRAIGGG